MYQFKSPHNELVSRLKSFFWSKNVFRVGQKFRKKNFKKNHSEKYVGSAQGSPNLQTGHVSNQITSQWVGLWPKLAILAPKNVLWWCREFLKLFFNGQSETFTVQGAHLFYKVSMYHIKLICCFIIWNLQNLSIILQVKSWYAHFRVLLTKVSCIRS